MRPIPKNLLIHSVTLSKTAEEDRWGNRMEQMETILTHVRMEPSKKMVRDKNNADKSAPMSRSPPPFAFRYSICAQTAFLIQFCISGGIFFYDCTNSRPKGVNFSVDDGIIFNGQRHKIQDVEPLYDRKKGYWPHKITLPCIKAP